MEGNKFITCDQLHDMSTIMCNFTEGFVDFPNGGKYQDILDRWCVTGKAHLAKGLFEICGTSDDTRYIDEEIHDTSMDIVFAGDMTFQCSIMLNSLTVGKATVVNGGCTVLEALKTFRIRVKGDLSVGGSILADTVRAKGSIWVGGMFKAGSVIRAEENIGADCDIKAGIFIIAGGNIQADGDINALAIYSKGNVVSRGRISVDESVLVDGNIKASRGIHVGNGIQAGGTIMAGGGYGIFAGLNVPCPNYNAKARITSSEMPDSIFSGSWEISDGVKVGLASDWDEE